MEPTRSGFTTAVLIGRDPDGHVDARVWALAVGKKAVAWCRRCGNPMMASEPIVNVKHPTALVWYPARCRDGHMRMASGARIR